MRKLDDLEEMTVFPSLPVSSTTVHSFHISNRKVYSRSGIVGEFINNL